MASYQTTIEWDIAEKSLDWKSGNWVLVIALSQTCQLTFGKSLKIPCASVSSSWTRSLIDKDFSDTQIL